MNEIRYHECNGLQTICPYGKKDEIGHPVYVWSLECKRCTHHKGNGSYFLKSGTSIYASIKCNYEEMKM